MFKFNSPSLKKNNELKESFIKSYNATIYKIEKRKVHNHLNNDELDFICNELKSNLENFNNSLGTGKEDIKNLHDNCVKKLKDLNKSLDQELMSPIKKCSRELIESVEEWENVLNGNIEVDLDEYKKAKVNWKEAKILDKLDQLLEIKTKLSECAKIQEASIDEHEKRIEEYNELLINENSQWKINDYYRKITSIKSDMQAYIARKSNYEACYNILNSVYESVNEIVLRSGNSMSKEDLAKARAYLDLDKLKTVINDPNKALIVLKKIQEDIKKLDENTKVIEKKIASFESNSATISEDALNYKEQLLAQKRLKESMEDLSKSSETKNKEKDEIKGEN